MRHTFPDESPARAQSTTTRILSEAANETEAIPDLLEAIGECFGWKVGAFWVIDHESQRLTCTEVWCDESIDVTPFARASWEFVFCRGEGLPGRVWKSGSALWLPRLGDAESFPRLAAAQESGLRGGAAFPLCTDSFTEPVLQGVIEFFSTEPTYPSDEVLLAMESIGTQIGQYLERMALRRHIQQVQPMELHEGIVENLELALTALERGHVWTVQRLIEEAIGAARQVADISPEDDAPGGMQRQERDVSRELRPVPGP